MSLRGSFFTQTVFKDEKLNILDWSVENGRMLKTVLLFVTNLFWIGPLKQ